MKIVKAVVIILLLFVLQIKLGSSDILIQDLFFNLRGPIKPSGAVCIAAIDDVSINVIGNWPWSRVKIAELIDSISSCQPAAIYVNIFFRKKTAGASGENDSASIAYENDLLSKSVQNAGNIILPYLFEEFQTDSAITLIVTPEKKVYTSRFTTVKGNGRNSDIKSALNLYYPEPAVAEKAWAVGLAKIAKTKEAQTNLALQVVKYGQDYYPTVSLVALSQFLKLKPEEMVLDLSKDQIRLGRDITIPLLVDGTAMINFCGGTNTFQHISASKIMDWNFRKEILRDKIVILGVTDKALSRESVPSHTPFDPALVSSEVWANIIENTLGRTAGFLNASSLFLSLIIPILLIIWLGFLTVSLPTFRFSKQLILLGLSAVGVMVVAFVLFLGEQWISIIIPLFYLFGLGIYTIIRRIKNPSPDEGQTSGQGSALLSTSEFNRTGQLVRVGRYQIQGEIGSGAMGTVYKALDPKINRTVAIKTLKNESSLTGNRESRERFLREAQAAGNILHPNIVTIYDCGDAENVTYIAMEYLEGISLSDRLAKEGRLNVKETLGIISQIAEGLTKAHAEGIIHRDVKPSNIMLLTDSNRVKLMDFGVAKICNASMTQTGKTLGTPFYMSPEQINAEEIDNRSDIFSLGVIAFEILSGKRPFRGENLSALSYAILYKKPENITDLVPELNSAANLVFSKVLSKDREERYQNARDFSDSLKAACL